MLAASSLLSNETPSEASLEGLEGGRNDSGRGGSSEHRS